MLGVLPIHSIGYEMATENDVLTVFLDTNMFIHGKPLPEMPWGELGSYSRLLIMVPWTVFGELDHLKHDGKERRAARARSALKLLKPIIDGGERSVVLKAANPCVAVQIANAPASLDGMPATLTKEIPDDRIIYEFMTGNIPNSLYITNDGPAYVKAKQLGCDCYHAGDSWLQTPEPDERDKEIHRLSARIEELQRNEPCIQLESIAIDGAAWNRTPVEIQRTLYPPLSNGDIQTVVESAINTHPIATDFGLAPPQEKVLDPILRPFLQIQRSLSASSWQSPSELEIDNYKKHTYPEWCAAIKKWSSEVHATLNTTQSLVPISFFISNSGRVPADDVVLELELSDGLVFLDGDNAEDRKIVPSAPPVPSAPHGRYVSWADKLGAYTLMPHGTAAHIRFPVINIPTFEKHDPHKFYFDTRDRNERRTWQLSCERFRHQVQPEEFSLTACISDADHAPKKGYLRVQLTAKNLPKPIQLTVPLHFIYVTGRTVEVALKLLSGR